MGSFCSVKLRLGETSTLEKISDILKDIFIVLLIRVIKKLG